ncbi:twitching motility protein PilT [Achromatium sp. WMS3]|nr:twitching motility protein PilT [Achromatium sp. WMS3]
MLTLIDTDILSLFLRNDKQVVARFNAYYQEYNTVSFSVVTWYEIVSGLKHKDAKRQLESFLTFAEYCQIIPLSQSVANNAADLYAFTRKTGTPVDDIDLLIAGTALTHGMAIATRNVSHFNRLPGLIVEDWSIKT